MPNPFFDTVTVCPIFSGTLRHATPWWPSNKRSSDILNRCSSSITSVPVSYWGNMEPAGGEGYAGIRTYQNITPDDTNYREYLAVPLKAPLEAGASYWVSFKVSPGGIAQLMTDDIGVHFSEDSIPGDFLLDWETHVGNPQGQILDNFGYWKTVSGQYNAEGGEQYLAIGNFEPDSTTTLVRRNTGGEENATYLFIDEVSVVLCGRGYPDSLIQYPASILCEGMDIQLGFDPIDSLVYTWEDGSQAPERTISRPGTYTLEARGKVCARRDTLVIEPELPVNLDPIGEKLLCGDDGVTISVIDESVIWEWADGGFAAQRDIRSPGIYVLRSESSLCIRYDTVEVKDAPEWPLPQTDTLCEGASLALVPDVNGFEYRWADGSDSLVRTVSQGGIYQLSLSNACESGNLELTVHEISCQCQMFVPNVFTPNNDGIHDAFLPEPGPEVLRYAWEIFDRWGRKVTEGSGSGSKWDGNLNGRPVRNGVYFYSLRYYCDFLPNKAEFRTGSLTLIR
ncbi:MAG: gliding motility-associated C-terminal domain-containing protein [Bacteroidota bacterium]